MNRIRVFILFVLCTRLLCAAPWNGSTTVPANDGTTYTVTTAEELAWVAVQSQTNDFAGKVIVLANDLDLGGTQATPPCWQPIGNEAKPFQGEMNGANHVLYNLYIMSSLFPKGAGLFAETGANAVIHHLGIAQGQIMTDATNNVGCLAGVHRGTIHHCFNMAQIIAHNGDRIGGLVGANYGTINHAYNTGIITDARDFVGGLVGYNYSSARLNECYNVGYCIGASSVGALFGKNEAVEAQVVKTYFDQQMTRMFATGDEGKDELLDNTKHAVEKTITFTSQDNPFYGLGEWDIIRNSYFRYPRLRCFGDHEASLVSTDLIILDAQNLPKERAEGVGTPMEGNKPRKEFQLVGVPESEWVSPSEDVIQIVTNAKAEVHRPCSNQPVILTVTEGTSTKQIYTIVKGYDNFDPGIVDGTASVCWRQENVKFISTNRGKEPTGGKDDEQDNPDYCYQYMIIRDTVTGHDMSGNPTSFAPIDTFYLSQEQYKNWWLPTDVPGEYAFRRYVHDAQCKTIWTDSKGKDNVSVGRLILVVRNKFDAGELYEKPDTLYGELPQTLTIKSKVDASGGDGNFHYVWQLEYSRWNAQSGAWVIDPQGCQNPVFINGVLVNTPSIEDYSFAKPGKYTFTRRVSNEACEGSPQEAKNPHSVYVFETLKAGSIQSFEHAFCTPVCTDTIHEVDSVSGGDGRYTFRWLCNNNPIADSNTAELLLEKYPMSIGNTYVFRRQVKDGTGYTGWVTSEGAVTIIIYREYDAGAIRAIDEHTCSETTIDEVEMDIREQRAANGDKGSEFSYCWLLFRGGKDTVLVDTIRQNEPTLTTTLKLSDYRLKAPVTIFVKRAVKNILCQTEWKHSDNSASWHLGLSVKKTVPVKVCELPYTYTYTYTDGHTENYRFTAVNETKVMSDRTEDGCPMEVTLQCVLMALPVVDITPIGALCETADSLAISYIVRQGAPDHFDLTFSKNAKEAGFRDTLNGIMPASHVITLPLPRPLAFDVFSFNIAFFAEHTSSSECKRSETQTQTFTIGIDGFVHRKDNEVIFVDNSGKHSEEGITFQTYQWFRNGEILEGENGQFYYEYNGLNGFYQAVMTGTDGKQYHSCVYEFRPMTPVENISDGRHGKKVLRDGRLLIVVGDKTYNMFGQEER